MKASTHIGLIVGVPFGLLVLLGLVFWSVMGSPDYTVSQLLIALQNHDRTRFDQVVNEQQVVSHYVDHAVQSSMPVQPADSPLEALGASLSAGLIAMVKPSIENQVHAQLDGYFTQPAPHPLSPTQQLWKALQIGVFKQDQHVKLTQTQIKGDTAYTDVCQRHPSAQMKACFRLTFLNTQSRWVLVDVVISPDELRQLIRQTQS